MGSQCQDIKCWDMWDLHWNLQTSLHKAFWSSFSLFWKQRITVFQFTANKGVSKHGSSFETQAASNSAYSYFTKKKRYKLQVIRESKTWVKDYTQVFSPLLGVREAPSRSIGKNPVISSWFPEHKLRNNRYISITFCIGIVVNSLQKPIDFVVKGSHFKVTGVKLYAEDGLQNVHTVG